MDTQINHAYACRSQLMGEEGPFFTFSLFVQDCTGLQSACWLGLPAGVVPPYYGIS